MGAQLGNTLQLGESGRGEAMREIVTRYNGECRRCAAAIAIGDRVVYERRVGVFCLACAPTDPEEIRAYRAEGAERKAAKLEEWADKRHAKAQALEARNAPYRGDIAFNTQPGHIPERARAIRRTEKAWEHSRKAQEMEARAGRLRAGVAVAGDAETRRESRREVVRGWIAKGMQVHDAIYGRATVLRVNPKTATIQTLSAFIVRVDLSHLTRLSPEEK